MSTLFDEVELSTATLDPENPAPAPDAPLPDPKTLIPHCIVSEILLDPQTRRPLAYSFDPDMPPARVQIDMDGIIWAGETIVAHLTQEGYIRHAMEMPTDPTPEVVRRITHALIANKTYLHNGIPVITTTNPDGSHVIHDIPTPSAFDTRLAACMAFVKAKKSKEGDYTFHVMQLDQRTAGAIFNSALMRESLPRIDTVNQVSLPYFSPDFQQPLFNPVGYNPENRTYTLGVASPEEGMTPQALKEWHWNLVKGFKWDDPEVDYPTYVAQTLSGFVTDMLTPTLTDGSSGERPVIPISLIESDSPEGGSGKSMLQYLSSVGPYGLIRERQVPNKEELYNAIVTAVKNKERVLFIDEAKHSMYDELLTVITGKAGGRVKGFSQEVEGNLHVLIAACLPKFSTMMARRILTCSVSTWPDYLTRQHDFITRANIPNHRQRMLAFCQALVRVWAEAGCPKARPNPQWPEYSAIVGGILEANGFRNTLHEKIAAADMAREGNDHIDAQWPAYFKLIASGELSFGDSTQDGKGSEPVVGVHQAKVLLDYAQAADFYPQIDPKRPTATRAFVASIGQWLNTGKPLFGYTFKKIHRNTGTCIEICKIPVDSTQS